MSTKIQGLPSVADLNNDEYAAWQNKNPFVKNYTINQKNQVYRNQKYIEKYGIDSFNTKSPEERDK
jgi:hypothetical protein